MANLTDSCLSVCHACIMYISWCSINVTGFGHKRGLFLLTIGSCTIHQKLRRIEDKQNDSVHLSTREKKLRRIYVHAHMMYKTKTKSSRRYFTGRLKRNMVFSCGILHNATTFPRTWLQHEFAVFNHVSKRNKASSSEFDKINFLIHIIIIAQKCFDLINCHGACRVQFVYVEMSIKNACCILETFFHSSSLCGIVSSDTGSTLLTPGD